MRDATDIRFNATVERSLDQHRTTTISKDKMVIYRNFSDGSIRVEPSFIGAKLGVTARIENVQRPELYRDPVLMMNKKDEGWRYVVDFETSAGQVGAQFTKTLATARRIAWYWVVRGERRSK